VRFSHDALDLALLAIGAGLLLILAFIGGPT
jgi:hypothetical protein